MLSIFSICGFELRKVSIGLIFCGERKVKCERGNGMKFYHVGALIHCCHTIGTGNLTCVWE